MPAQGSHCPPIHGTRTESNATVLVCAVYVNRSNEGAAGHSGAGNTWVDEQESPATGNAWEGMRSLALMGANGRRVSDINSDGIPDFIGGVLDYYDADHPEKYIFRS